jgi:DNA polymerase III epsilon subunit-like protein
MQTVYLDTETTGLDAARDEVIEIGIVDDAGQPLLSSLVRPERATAWPDAERINGISPAMVAGAPTLAELLPAIRAATAGKRVVIYSAGFDVPFVPGLDQWAAEIRCAMLAFAEFAGEWNEDRAGYRWHRLAVAARHVCFEWPGDAHRATADAQACRAVWRYLTEPAERHRVELEHAAALERIADNARQHQQAARHAHRMDTFWRHWWLRQYGAGQHWISHMHITEREDALSRVFFGKPPALLQLEDAGLPVYRRQAEIPAMLRPANRFPKEQWIRDALMPSAVYVGQKTGWHLYHESELDRLKEKYPLRFAPATPWLVTATKLKKLGLSREQIARLKPVAERRNPHTHRWYRLYTPPEADE